MTTRWLEMTDKTLSLSIPMYNEEYNIAALHEALTKVLHSIPEKAPVRPLYE